MFHFTGVLLLNLVCRNEQLKASVVNDIRSVFRHAYMLPNAEDINEVVYALPSHREKIPELSTKGELPKEVRKNVKHLQESIKLQGHRAKVKSCDILQLTKLLDNLKML